MTISKKEITALVDKSYSRLLRRILTAFILNIIFNDLIQKTIIFRNLIILKKKEHGDYN